MEFGVIPVSIASPDPTAYRSLPGHRSNDTLASGVYDGIFHNHLSKTFRLWDELVGILGEVLLGLQEAAGHDDDFEDLVVDSKKAKVKSGRVYVVLVLCAEWSEIRGMADLMEVML
jgi:hypothetical protein